MGIEFADAVGRGVAHVGARVALSEEDRAAVVRKLMIQTTPAEVAEKARAIAIERAATQPAGEGVVPVAENTDLNDMTLVQTDEGRVSATLDLDALTGEELFAALDPLCRPVPLPDGSPDPRPPGRRRADAFGQIMRTYLSSSGRPTSGGVLPHVTLIRPAGVDTLGFTGPVSAVTADLVACDSTLRRRFGCATGRRARRTVVHPRNPKRTGRPVIVAARTPGVGGRCPGATPTTSNRGTAEAPPASITECCCAGHTTP